MIIKTLLVTLFSFSFILADAVNIWVTPEFIDENKKMTIIDIRTAPEWRETGIVENSHTITFFDENGKFNVPSFISKIDKIVNKEEQFGIICRTGSRTFEVAKFLGDQLGYNVINLGGGIMKLQHEGYETTKYNK